MCFNLKMAQDKNSGRKAREFGLQAARELIRALGGKQCREGSNEFLWEGKLAVLKSAKPGNTIIGVTPKMRERLDVVVAAFQLPHSGKGKERVFELYAFHKADFNRIFYEAAPRSDGSQLWFARKVVIVECERLGSHRINIPE